MSADNMQLPVPNQAAMQQHVEHLFLNSMHGLVELAWTDVDAARRRMLQLSRPDRLDELVEKAAHLNAERRNVYIGACVAADEHATFWPHQRRLLPRGHLDLGRPR